MQMKAFFTCLSLRNKLIYVSRSGLLLHLCYITVPHSVTGIGLVLFCVTSFYQRLQDLFCILTIYSDSGVALYSICSAIGTLRHSIFWIILMDLGGLIACKTRVGTMTGPLSFLLPNLGKSCTVFKIIVLSVFVIFVEYLLFIVHSIDSLYIFLK